MDQIVEDNNECSAIIEKHTYQQHRSNAEAQSKPRYASVIRNQLPTGGEGQQSSQLHNGGDYPSARAIANHNSVCQLESQRRTLMRKAATNDLYSMVGHQITQTPRNQME